VRYGSEANTMQALVKYHGLRDWKLRIPYHDSISVNTTSLFTRAVVTDEGEGVIVNGRENEDAARRLAPVIERLTGNPARSVKARVESKNVPEIEAKGLGFSSSAGAALTLAFHRLLVGGEPDYKALSRVARLFAASASRTIVGGFSRLYAGRNDEETFAEKFADEKDLDLRMVIVPFPSTVRTEEAHKDVESSPFFKARIESAQKRCKEMERAIIGGDLKKMGELAEQDTLELHSLTMTGKNRRIIFTEDTLRVITKVRELRSNSVQAFFSMQTGPTVFINTTEEDQEKVRKTITKLGYKTILSGVGKPARLIRTRRDT
jgi:diphosphomevalonate decarboxylase